MEQLINRRMAAWVLAALALFGGLAAGCDEGGMHQGGDDAEPYYR